MAGSGYYYDQYKKSDNRVRELSEDISTLTKIKDSLSFDFSDEQRNVNAELEDLKSDLEKAVRHDDKFTINANNNDSHKEKGILEDTYLVKAESAIENEIASLNTQKTQAERSRDENWRDYQDAKEQEHREWLESLKNMFER